MNILRMVNIYSACLLSFTSLQLVLRTVACVPSRSPDPGTTTIGPITTTTTTIPGTTTTSSNPECGTALMQTLTSSAFADGDMTFVYDDELCPRIAQMTCFGDPIYELNAGIVINEVFFLDYDLNTVTVEARWNATDGLWYVSEEQPLAIVTIECLLTDLP